MNWKICIIAFISTCMVAFPANIIGCGPDVSPYDYYTSFFSKNSVDSKSYRPFYYTSYSFLHSEEEAVSQTDLLLEEWAAYCGKPVTVADVAAFMFGVSRKDQLDYYNHVEKLKPAVVGDSVSNNAAAIFFKNQKDLEALGYILYARQVEPYVTVDYNNWETPVKDSVKMDRLIKNGHQLYKAAKKDFFKLKYAYQVVRLAHYSGRYQDAIDWYDAYIAGNKVASVLQPMSLSLKAGALMRLGKSTEAAYLFSKAFSDAEVKRIPNYISFRWSLNPAISKESYLAMCQNGAERAAMLGLFALGSTADETATIEQIYQSVPASPILQVLAVREINKLEEYYFTPMLRKQIGGQLFNSGWWDEKSDSMLLIGKSRIDKLSRVLHDISNGNETLQPGLFETGAAYCALMVRDYTNADRYIRRAKDLPMAEAARDQWALTNLLLQVNQTQRIDEKFEADILPSIKWLREKALEDITKYRGNGFNASEWQRFFRDMLGEVIAKRYHQQGDFHKEVLAVGVAEKIYFSDDQVTSFYGVNYMHNNLVSKEVEVLYNYMTNKKSTNFDAFLIKNNGIKLSDVIDFAGTAYLRDGHYAKAIEWFAKSDIQQGILNKNPFADLLYDQVDYTDPTGKVTNKLAFAEEMKALHESVAAGKGDMSKFYYKIALGLYNTSYYGNSWDLVDYFRSGSDGYFIPAGANSFKRNYYGCFEAHDYFKKAMDAATDPSFKARCLFMMAKCAQKQLRRPQYSDFSYDKWDDYTAAEKVYMKNFTNNKYFPQFIKEFKHTAFYKEAFNSCSYLRDFVAGYQ